MQAAIATAAGISSAPGTVTRSNVAPARSIAAVAPASKLIGDVVVETRLDDEQMERPLASRSRDFE